MMTVYRQELRQGRKIFLIWTAAISLFMVMCLVFYPEMKGEMEKFSKLFSAMGMFTAAFGMDRLDFGSLTGFYAIECGNILSVGGGFFAAIIAVTMLSKEEYEHTSEFLFVHPVSRVRVCTEKILALLTQIAGLNLIVTAVTFLSLTAIGEPIPFAEICLLHLAFFFCQIELAMICYAISAFLRGNTFGIGLGICLCLYFMNLIANISDQMKIFKILSPYGYAEGADVITAKALDVPLVALGMGIALLCAVLGTRHYSKKDLFA